MTTRFKRGEGPQKYHRIDPNWRIPFSNDEPPVSGWLAGGGFVLSLWILLLIYGLK